MEYRTVRFNILGLSALLMNNPGGMARRGAGGLGGPKTIPTPDDEAASKVYRLDNGQLYLPTMQFRASVINAAVGRRIEKKAAPGIVAAAVLLTHEVCPLVNPDTGQPIDTYAVDVQRAVVQRQGVMRARPRLDRWATTIEYEYDSDFINEGILAELMTLAGRIIGVGDFRPKCPGGKGGPYGRFTVELAA